MIVKVFDDARALGRAAAVDAAALIRAAVARRGGARIIAATGASQFDFLDALTAERDVPWTQVELFHLDEYVGLPADHPASFRRFLTERLIEKTGITRYHFLKGEGDAAAECARVGALLAQSPVDVAFVGIGENGHLAFNDPPADFETEDPYLIVHLDHACRRQQVGEGWFATVDDVPDRAISMSIRQILKAQAILAIVPESRKAQAVKACLEGEITPLAPASILRTHPRTTIYLDDQSAALLEGPPQGGADVPGATA
jgi:glucosamine-6-phosphate deaminase